MANRAFGFDLKKKRQKDAEQIQIDEDINIKAVHIQRDNVRIDIETPEDIKFVREEVAGKKKAAKYD